VCHWAKRCEIAAAAAEDDLVFAKCEWQEWRKGEVGSKIVGGGAVWRVRLSQ